VAHFIDPNKAFQVASNITKPNGFWLIETWNRQSWTARIFGKSWHEYSPPSVLHWFSRDGLGQLAGKFGFREVAHGRPPKWIHPIHAKTLAQYKYKNAALGKLFISMIKIIPDRFPIPYPGDDIFWALFQKR
jgi:hypothetical protein